MQGKSMPCTFDNTDNQYVLVGKTKIECGRGKLISDLKEQHNYRSPVTFPKHSKRGANVKEGCSGERAVCGAASGTLIKISLSCEASTQRDASKQQ